MCLFLCVCVLFKVIALSVTGALNMAFSEEHKREIRRYLYNHQVKICISKCIVMETCFLEYSNTMSKMIGILRGTVFVTC